jgi:hypothetical protein
MSSTEILNNLYLKIGTASKSHVAKIIRASDDEGTIQAEAMVALFPGEPTLHTTTSLSNALVWAGCIESE